MPKKKKSVPSTGEAPAPPAPPSDAPRTSEEARPGSEAAPLAEAAPGPPRSAGEALPPNSSATPEPVHALPEPPAPTAASEPIRREAGSIPASPAEPGQAEGVQAEASAEPEHVLAPEPVRAEAESPPESVQAGAAPEPAAGPEHAEAPPQPAAAQPEPEKPAKFLVVGIGASAGGLEALGELMPVIPPRRMAFIVVQHLAPRHESLLAQLLARSSKLTVVTAADGMPLEIDHVYVIPPNADLAVMGGVIHLITPTSPLGPHLPIDFLFRSLADDVGPSAIGVVLSGTGTDGTFGLKAIKAAGGITFVQDPSSAKYDGMPRSALASGAADFCLTPRQIGEELSRIAAHPRHPSRPRPIVPEARIQDALTKLFVLIRAEFGNDLSHYKTATVERRIERRMMLHKLGRLEDYVRYVQSNPEELHALYSDMLITVTSFFRDPEAFEALKSRVLAQLVEQKKGNEPIRVWVPACATGEEAYSIAICLLELVEERARDTRLQIFGTDIDDESIQHARRGIYPANIALDVSPERLSRYFIKKESEYQIARRVRDQVVFSRQNILKDAPFSRIDLVSCRNLLIYLQPAAQKKVLRIAHYALNPTGYLVLGSSETVGDSADLFSLVDRKHKIYAKKMVTPPAGLDVNLAVAPAPELPHQPPMPRPALSLQGLADRKVLDLYGPPGVIISEELEILQFRGRTGPYLDPTPGAPSFNVLRVARFELHIELKRTIQQALSQGLRATTEVTYQDDGQPRAVKLDVVPLEDPETKTRCLLVLFQRVLPPREVPVVSPGDGATDDAALGQLAQRIHELERELAMTKDYLQTTIEEKESTTEELKSANEELQSSNEELQSTNEELETSKEEMQSTNEELTTVNEELQNRMAELSQTNDDLHNVLSGVDNAVIIVGMDLRIRRYTGAAERLFNLVPGDLGRAINFVDPFLQTSPLAPKVSAVIESLSSVEEEVLAANQRWYMLRINPYKTLDHAIRGALVSLTDIDVRKRAAEMTRDIGAYAARMLAAIGHPLVIIDRRLRIVWVNDVFLATFRLSHEETVGNLLTNLGARAWADPGLRERLDALFTSGTLFRDYEMRVIVEGIGEFALRVGGSQLAASSDVPLALLSLEPIGAPAPRGTS